MEWILVLVSFGGIIYWLFDYNRKFGSKFLKHDKKQGKVVL